MSQQVLLPNTDERQDSATDAKRASSLTMPIRKKIWLDLENTPHVPFFKPIIDELEKLKFPLAVTARDCFQVCDLADLTGLRYKKIGRHYGKHKIAKIAGLLIRSAALAPTVWREKPVLALSHGSRSLFLIASIMKVPTITIFDYEHSKWVKPVGEHWVIVPEVMPEAAITTVGIKKERILRYPGIKEDVYAPFFRPDPQFRAKLDLAESDIVVTIRPPSSEAHYRNEESDKLLGAVLELVAETPRAKVVLVPRTKHQEMEIRSMWPTLFESGKAMVPQHVVNGLDLIWQSDVVVSGGGTMNREAAALGVPVYSIFRGKTGCVDQYLESSGRLTMLASQDDVRQKLKLERRFIPSEVQVMDRGTLRTIVNHIVNLVQSKS